MTGFVARDIRRDVKVVSVNRMEEGIITAQIKTNNILYTARGLQDESDFEEEKEVRIDQLWDWSGVSWGGLPDGTSLVKRELKKKV